MAGHVPRGEITQLLSSWRDGDREAFDKLFSIVYDELRVLAQRQLNRVGPPRSLTTTALVHEGYLRLVDRTRSTPRDRSHFFALAAMAMRQILVDHARRRQARKRGDGRILLPYSDLHGPQLRSAPDILAIDESLSRLQTLDPRMVRIVELRFFAGLSIEETAEALEVSSRTVKREWQKARAYLYHELTRGSE